MIGFKRKRHLIGKEKLKSFPLFNGIDIVLEQKKRCRRDISLTFSLVQNYLFI